MRQPLTYFDTYMEIVLQYVISYILISMVFSVTMFYMGLGSTGKWYNYYKTEDELSDESTAGGNAMFLLLSLMFGPVIMPYYAYILWEYSPWKLD